VIQLHCGNSLDVLATLGDDSVDSIVTDPPYGFGNGKRAGFMGKQWDYDVPSVDIWVECLRVLKPGGHLLAFAGTRTQHRMCVNIEDAGFEIRDMIAWVYGSGMPKSHNISKAIDKAAGAEREIVGLNPNNRDRSSHNYNSVGNVGSEAVITAPATPEAQQWEGFGTSLKPSLEPITVARKPLSERTVAANVLEHGTGAINIDGCRVPTDEKLARPFNEANNEVLGKFSRFGNPNEPNGGRWPANLIHDGSDEVTELFPHTTSGKPSGVRGASKHNVAYADVAVGSELTGFGDSGSAARFFYCAKANKKDREEGNTHPTVKPTDLMAYLVRLITPPGGVVLDPFMGSGSTGKAAVREGFDFIGIEREEEYVAIASKRLQVIQRSIMASRSADQNG
jgi:DNA modification methylase